MSDPINANPEVLDVSALPTRNKGQSQLDMPLGAFLDTRPTPLSLIQNESASGTDDDDEDDDEPEPIDSQEIYDLIATISDPEHPLTLGQLAVVKLEDIWVHDSGDKDKMAEIVVKITPTITHCSLATLIGLGIRVRLERALPPRFRFTITVKEGTHQSENQVNKQLNDKERVAAACENEQLLGVISGMLATCQ
ncbi:MIP18 family protein [Yarrowia sp. C11]|nr:MIP18 family protein [Yarrowia sp. E02]KAG5372733.1 MIP18 family protein [Yarrowia sp. C11]